MRTVLDTGTSLPRLDTPATPLSVGDVVTVSTAAGWQSRLQITAVTATAIDGTRVDSDQRQHIEFADVTRIERREFNGIQTALLVVALCAVVYIMAVAAATAALAGNL